MSSLLCNRYQELIQHKIRRLVGDVYHNKKVIKSQYTVSNVATETSPVKGNKYETYIISDCLFYRISFSIKYMLYMIHMFHKITKTEFKICSIIKHKSLFIEWTDQDYKHVIDPKTRVKKSNGGGPMNKFYKS